MRTKALFACIVLALWFHEIEALQIYLAPLAYQEEESTREVGALPDLSADLLAKLLAASLGDSVALRRLTVASAPPQTFIDAARICETQDCPYLMYGYVKHTSYSYYAELKLMAKEDKHIVAVFIGGDDDGHYARLVDDVAAKVELYIRGDLGIGPALPRQAPARRLLYLPTSIGYWTALGHDWSSALAGLAAASTGLRFVPERPLFSLAQRPCALAAGLDLEYQLGMNRDGMEPFLLHEARLRIPAEVWSELGRGHELGFGLGALFDFDILSQAQEYGPTRTVTSVGSGMSIELLYRYSITNRLSLGGAALLDLLFYDVPLLTLSPRLTCTIQLGREAQP